MRLVCLKMWQTRHWKLWWVEFLCCRCNDSFTNIVNNPNLVFPCHGLIPLYCHLNNICLYVNRFCAVLTHQVMCCGDVTVKVIWNVCSLLAYVTGRPHAVAEMAYGLGKLLLAMTTGRPIGNSPEERKFILASRTVEFYENEKSVLASEGKRPAQSLLKFLRIYFYYKYIL